MSQFSVIQLPPNSTGSKVIQTSVHENHYRNKQNGGFTVGDVVTTASGLAATVVKVKENTGTTGEIYCRLNGDHFVDDYVEDEDITVDSTVRGTISVADGVEDFYTQDIVLTGGNNPINKAFVNEEGALTTAFAHGSPGFDAFGKLQIAEQTVIREYRHDHGINEDDWTIEKSGAGANVTFDDVAKVVVLQTGTANGEYARIRSNLYHRYQVGVGTTWLFSGYLGDTGKTGVHRRVGLFDDDDGLFFHAMEDSANGLGCVVRSSTTGSVVETHYHQNAWNVDRLDGTGGILNISGHTLDPTKTQVLFIDYQWLGAGRVRFGFVIDGVPVTCHEVLNSNEASLPYMRTGNLPITIEQMNSSAPATPSFLYNIASTVRCDGKWQPREILSSQSLLDPADVNSNTDYTPIFSFRSSKFAEHNGFANLENRAVTLPTLLSLTDTSGATDVWLMEIVKNDTIDGAVFEDTILDNTIEVATPSSNLATSNSGSVIYADFVVGHETIDLKPYFSQLSEIIIRKADIDATPSHYTIRGKLIGASSNVSIVSTLTWKEIH